MSLQRDWRPNALHAKLLSSLLVGLIMVSTALLVLRYYAERQQLYRSAFVYQVDLGFFKARLSPHSVIATLIAVGVALWWEAIDKHIRILQPYLAMSRNPERISNGAALSYQSSYWIWAASKALMNKHWLLFLVASGTTLCQVRK